MWSPTTTSARITGTAADSDHTLQDSVKLEILGARFAEHPKFQGFSEVLKEITHLHGKLCQVRSITCGVLDPSMVFISLSLHGFLCNRFKAMPSWKGLGLKVGNG